MDFDYKRYYVMGALWVVREDFSIIDLARFSGVKEDEVSRIVKALPDITITEVGSSNPAKYKLDEKSQGILKQQIEDVFDSLPRPLLTRTPPAPLSLLLIEQDLYKVLSSKRVSERDGIFVVADIHIKTAEGEIKALVRLTNKQTRPLMANLEYRLLCAQSALGILKACQESNKKLIESSAGDLVQLEAASAFPTKDCLSLQEIEDMGKGKALRSDRQKHLEVCDLCQYLMASMPPEKRSWV